MSIKSIALGLALTMSTAAIAQTTEIAPSVFRVESGVDFQISNVGSSDYVISWTDTNGTFGGMDPTLILTSGESYTFTRTSGSHPFVITDDTLPVSGSDGSYSRTTFDGAVIDAATLAPIADFTADPAPTADFIQWDLMIGDEGDYYYTCRVTGHLGMTGRIQVVEAGGVADQRDIQVRSVDFASGTIELYNYGTVDQDLSGWRTCTHDFDDVRRYSSSGGLNGVMIEAGTSVWFHYNNDAPADPDRLNISDIGGTFASPLDQDAYGLQLYFPDTNGNVSFGNGSLIADHIQWNIDGSGVGNAEFRTVQSVSEGLWTAIGDFIATETGSESIELTDLGDGRFHGPGNYTVNASCPADLNDDDVLDFFDISFFLSNQVDFNEDTVFDFFDISAFLSAFGAGCP
ncbi:MAG: hypothetical protein JJ974_01575 [Phycisphaerales bacterium]|nr:hypothetical protein [Phycisphaerales bacterium]